MRQGLGVVRSVVRTGRRHDHGDRGRKPYARRTHGDDLGLCHQGRERHAARDAGRCERFGPGDALLCQDRRLGRQGRPDMGDGDHAGQRDRPGDERRRDPCGCGFLRAFGSADGHEDRAGQHVRNPQQLLDDRRLSGRCGRGRRGRSRGERDDSGRRPRRMPRGCGDGGQDERHEGFARRIHDQERFVAARR